MTEKPKAVYYVAEPGSGPEARSAWIHDEERMVTICVDARRRFQDPLPIAKAIVTTLNGAPDPEALAMREVVEAAIRWIESLEYDEDAREALIASVKALRAQEKAGG